MLENILSTIISTCGVFLVLHNISNRKIDFKNKKIYLAFILMCIFTIFNFYCVNAFVRLIMSTLIVFIGNWIIFKDEIRNNLVNTIFAQLIVIASELIYMLVLICIIQPVGGVDFINTTFGGITSNLVISVIMVLISICIYVKKLYLKCIELCYKIKVITLIAFVLIIILPINLLTFMVYYGSSMLNMLLVNIVFISVYGIIVYFAISEKSENAKFKQENEILLDSLNEYEKMLDYQRVNNHENKNQLLVIRGMINANNKKALAYLDEVINEKRKDDEGLYTFTKIIPEGGLQGLVYQKVLKMKENNIKIDLDIDKKIRKVNFDCMSSKVIYDLCKAVGIILDNAIEEVVNLEEREILISMYKDEKYFFIEVSNKCSVIPDLSKLDEKGYTTKSKGHGYGLCILKDIVTNNKCIINIRSINKDIFTQTIKIKCKN